SDRQSIAGEIREFGAKFSKGCRLKPMQLRGRGTDSHLQRRVGASGKAQGFHPDLDHIRTISSRLDRKRHNRIRSFSDRHSVENTKASDQLLRMTIEMPGEQNFEGRSERPRIFVWVERGEVLQIIRLSAPVVRYINTRSLKKGGLFHCQMKCEAGILR